MPAIKIDGRATVTALKEGIKQDVEVLQTKDLIPTLAMIVDCDDKPSVMYVNMKKKALEELGMRAIIKSFDSNVTQNEILDTIKQLNIDKSVNGILVQVPLPVAINVDEIMYNILPIKDVDCFHPENLGLLFEGHPRYQPCTPLGAMVLLKTYGIALKGKNCVIIGKTNVLGKPQAMMMLEEDATVTICHEHTKNIEEYTKKADIVIAAIDKAKFLTADMVREGAVVVDCGANMTDDGKVCGDADYEPLFEKCSYITPVPGGTGPMTISMLLKNTIDACYLQNAIER